MHLIITNFITIFNEFAHTPLKTTPAGQLMTLYSQFKALANLSLISEIGIT